MEEVEINKVVVMVILMKAIVCRWFLGIVAIAVNTGSLVDNNFALLNIKDGWNVLGCKTHCCRENSSFSGNVTENCTLENRPIITDVITFCDKERKGRDDAP